MYKNVSDAINLSSEHKNKLHCWIKKTQTNFKFDTQKITVSKKYWFEF